MLRLKKKIWTAFIRKSFTAIVRARHNRSSRAAGMRQMASRNPSIVLYRILGNDLVPRHRVGQTLENLKITIEREAAFSDCEKRFVVNRIIDAEYEAAIIDVLESANLGYIRIPFNSGEYSRRGWEVEPFGGLQYFQSDQFARLTNTDQQRRRLWACAPRIRYAMNVNGARNMALAEGRRLGDWVLPFDGNGFATEQCFEALRRSCVDFPELPYRVMPMVRESQNAEGSEYATDHNLTEEPQLCFHRTTNIRFDERLPYGLRDKAELIMRLGVPGFWDKWAKPNWMPKQRVDKCERYLFATVRGAIVRLSSGVPQLGTQSGQAARYKRRNIAILATIKALDQRYGNSEPSIGERGLDNSERFWSTTPTNSNGVFSQDN